MPIIIFAWLYFDGDDLPILFDDKVELSLFLVAEIIDAMIGSTISMSRQLLRHKILIDGSIVDIDFTT